MIQRNSTAVDLVAVAPESRLFERLTLDLQPAAKILAQQIARSPTGFAILAFLRRYPHRALTAGDIAALTAQPPADVTAMLNNWVVAGLIEDVTAGDLRFYRLTHDPSRLCELEEVFAWQAFWMSQVRSIAQAVGVSLPPPPHQPAGQRAQEEDGG
jgi:hypothetical protein